MVKLAPNMRLPLLSRRVVIKKSIAEKARAKDAREEVLRFAVENHKHALPVASGCQRARFAVATASPTLGASGEGAAGDPTGAQLDAKDIAGS
eukprot:8434605-Alexandrium_andersonii.AAC.1